MSDHWEPFLSVLETVPVGHHVSSNVLRSLMTQAEIPEKARGGLFSMAVKHGHLRLLSFEPSTGTTARKSVVRLYVRLRPNGVKR
jgi:hypothetical protein